MGCYCISLGRRRTANGGMKANAADWFAASVLLLLIQGCCAVLEPARVSCNAAYSASCARTNSEWLATSTAQTLQTLEREGIDRSLYMSDLTKGIYNYDTGFYPFLFDSITSVCLAHGANPALVGLRIDEIFDRLQIGYSDATALHERFVKAAKEGGNWVQYLWHDGTTNSKLAYVTNLTAVNDGSQVEMYLGVGYEDVQLPPDVPCSAQWDTWCSHTNVPSLVGAAQFHLNEAVSLENFEAAIFDLSFKDDLQYRIPDGFYTFMYNYKGPLKSHAILHDSFGLDLGDIFVKIGLGTRGEGLQLHDQFVAAAEGLDAGWVQYSWRNSLSEPTYTKIAFVVKIEFGEEEYYLGAGYNFALGAVMPGPLGKDCPATFNPPCAYKTTLQLTSHAASHAISSPTDSRTMFQAITSDTRFKIGQFYVFAYEMFGDGKCVAHGAQPGFVGKSLQQIFDEIGISLNATRLHEQFRTAAENGGGFVEYDWVIDGVDSARFKKTSYIFRLNIDGVDYYAGTGFNQERTPLQVHAERGRKKNGDRILCSSQYGMNCSNVNAQAILGEAVTQLTIASTAAAIEGSGDEPVNQVLASISDKTDETLFVNDFHVMVFGPSVSPECPTKDESGCCVAHGGNASFVNMTWQEILDAHGITAIKGHSLHEQLSAESGNGCGYVQYPWSGVDQSGDEAALFKHAWTCGYRSGVDVSSKFYVVSEYMATQQPATCDACPDDMHCASGDDAFCVKKPAPESDPMDDPAVFAMVILLGAGVPLLAGSFLYLKTASKRRAREKIRLLELEKQNLAQKLDNQLVQIVEVSADLQITSTEKYREKLALGEHAMDPTGKWYWEEDFCHMGIHALSSVLTDTQFVQYLPEISHQIEQAHQQWLEGKGHQLFHVDLTNKIVINTHQKNGAEYEVDFGEMVQRNAKTRHARTVRREEEEQADLDAALLAKLPPLPEGVDLSPGDQNLLPLFAGQIIQVSEIHSDQQWAFGNVLFDPLLHDAKEQAGAVKTDTRLTGLMTSALLDRPTSGWFPLVATEAADMTVMKKLIDEMGGGFESLATPETWEEGRESDGEGLFEVATGTHEHTDVSSFFYAALYFQRDDIQLVRIERVQNTPLWQSYEVKRQTMKTRNNSNPECLINNLNPDAVERKWLFHGTTPDVAPKIVKQGFNRAFAGRNAVAYGRGVYFARDASYSSHDSYATKDQNGIQRMFLCRVAVGDWCKGSAGQLTPDAKPHSHVELFDTTVDNVSNPSIFVVYHDAQVYPEYLVSFKRRA